MDTRQYRDDQICVRAGQRNCRDFSLFEQGSILGEKQHAWLESGLDSAFSWNMVAQQVVVMPIDHRESDSDKPNIPADAWGGYPASRRMLVDSIQRKGVSNVIISTGDVHQNIVGYLPQSDNAPEQNAVATEFVCTSISSLGDGQDVKIIGADFSKLIPRNPNLMFVSGQRGYQAFNISEREWRTDIMKVDKISDRSGKLSRLKSFVVESGRAIPNEA